VVIAWLHHVEGVAILVAFHLYWLLISWVPVRPRMEVSPMHRRPNTGT
jgi:hypothetical protein